jgi:hypothetical protein
MVEDGVISQDCFVNRVYIQRAFESIILEKLGFQRRVQTLLNEVGYYSDFMSIIS